MAGSLTAQPRVAKVPFCFCDGGCSRCRNTPANKISAARSGHGTALPAHLQQFFGVRFGQDFGRVRLHTGPEADHAARGLQARAFTIGNDVVFGGSAYQPETLAGRRLLAHELAHVVQQGHGATPRVQRSCDCGQIPGARGANGSEAVNLERDFPRLRRGDYCITGPVDPGYNCFAWSVGITDHPVVEEIDSLRDNNVRYVEADAFYADFGLFPVRSMANAVVITYGQPDRIVHAARRTPHHCDGEILYESKLGEFERIIHKAGQIEGTYGTITDHHYIPMAPTALYNPYARRERE